MKTFDSLLENIKTTLEISLIPSTKFERKPKLWWHKQRLISVIHDQAEMRLVENDERPLLGAFHASPSENENECWIFPDSIEKYGIDYSNYSSLIYRNGEYIGDLRKSTGVALFPEEASERIEMICKIELTILRIFYSSYGNWASQFYSDHNRDFIDMLIYQITKETIKEDDDLIDCFKWMNQNLKLHPYEIDSALFMEPVSCVKHLWNTSDDEFKTILTLEKHNKQHFPKFINCFPVSDKKSNETWDAFFNRSKEKAQQKIIDLIKKERWDTNFEKYLTEENKEKYKTIISAKKLDLL
jgi:hypothetical protein